MTNADVGSLWSLEVDTAAFLVARTDNVSKLQPRVLPICARVTDKDQSVLMEVDTGALHSVVGEAEFKRHFPRAALEQSDVKWRG